MELPASGDSRFDDVLVKALRRLGVDCELMHDQVLHVRSMPSSPSFVELKRRLERVLAALIAVKSDLLDGAACGEEPEAQLLLDLAGHAVNHPEGRVPEICIRYVASARDLPESLVRSVYALYIRSSPEDEMRLVRELCSFLG